MSTVTPLAEALALAAKGLQLFPLKPGAKLPAVKGWQDAATSDSDTLRAWAEDFPACGFGLVTGRGIVAVDLDVKDGKDGEATLRALMAEAGVDGLPPTWISRTASGGYHLIFKVGAAIGNSAGKLGNGVDTRGDGGYIVAAGSAVNGGSYQWAPGFGPDDLPQPADCPEWLLDRMGRATAKAADTRTPAIPGELMDDSDALARARAFLAAAEPALEGSGGDHHTYATICRARDCGVSEPMALEMLTEAGGWNERCAPPWNYDELAAKVANAYRYAQEPPASKHPAAFGFEPVEIAPRHGAQAAVAAAEGTPVETFTPQAPERRVLRLEPFGDVEPDLNRPQLVKGILHPGTLAVMFGPPNEGKTFAALSLAVSVATGEPWLGHETARGPVIYCALEGGGGIRARMAGFRQHYDLKGQDVPLFLLAEGLNLRDAKGHTDTLIDAAGQVRQRSRQGVGLIVVDTLSRALAGGDENSSVDMGALVDNLDRVRAATGATVLVLHHVPRDAAGRPRGHSILDGAADTLIRVEKGGQVGRISATKQRDLEYGPPIGFRLLPLTVGITTTGRPVTTCIVERAENPANTKPLKEGGQHEAVLKVLARLCATEGKQVEGAIPPSLPMVPVDTWKSCSRGSVFEGLSDESARANFNRVKRQLGANGYVVIHQNYCGVAPQ